MSEGRRSPIQCWALCLRLQRALCRQVGIIRLPAFMHPHSGCSVHYSRPVHFAYVQFGGCDWSILSGWMPVQTSLTGVNTDIADCMNNACAASTVPYQVMRIDFLRWISLIIRCSLDVVVGAEPEHAGCVWHRTFCAQLYNADKKEIRIPLHTVYIHHPDQERFCLSCSFTMIVDCIDFLSLIYSYVAKRTTPQRRTFAVNRPWNSGL